jgi:8-oxo-dGTP diphosphatase
VSISPQPRGKRLEHGSVAHERGAVLVLPPGGTAQPCAEGPVGIVTSPRGVLVGRRMDGKPPWTFIAGEQEPGERAGDTAVREVKEETGLRVRAGEVIGERVHPKSGRHMIYMAAAPTRGLGVISDALAGIFQPV